MSSSEKQDSKSISKPINAGVTEEPLLQLKSTCGQAGTSFNNSAPLSDLADSAMSPVGSCPADLDGDNLQAFSPPAGHSSEPHRLSLVDAVIEQLRHARLKRQRPH